MKSIRYAALASMVLCGYFQNTWAQAASEAREPVILKKWHLAYDIDRDGRTTQTFESRHEVVQARAIEAVKTRSFSFSTGIQRGEVLEAYTLKKDGRKIPVPANNFQTTTNTGRGEAGPMFSDRTSISVVFPDLEAGDSVGLIYRLTDKEPMFPGHFSMAQSFSPYSVSEDAQITVRAPKDLKLGVESHGLQEVPVSEAGDIRTLQWNYRNLKPLQWNESDAGIWRMEETPSVAVSTFENYEAIAKAYGDRALPKAEPTARIRELAQGVIGSETRPQERARLLYEWVSKNITYGGNCIGVGAVVPRDLDVVLDNKMGDCKDHATLLQALLSAAGVRSEQVLINAGDMYDLTQTPVVSLVNHVMNFLPDFNLYVDATAKEIPFGYLPMGSYGKPVIHVGSAKALAKTPNQDHNKAEQRLAMKLALGKDGTASGELKVSLKGLQAAQMRAFMRDLGSDAERDLVKWALGSHGYKGKGSLQKGDTSGMSDQYAYTLSFDISNYLEGGASGAFVLAPVTETPLPVMTFASVKGRTEPSRRHTCHGFHSYETYDISLPPGLKLVSLPSAATIRSAVFDYTAKYQRTKAGLLVAREVHDKTPDSVCTPEQAAELHKQALPAADNLRTQVVYARQMR